MRTAQYTRAERSIAAADTSGIRERWLYGLRLLADTDKIAPGGGLKHDVAAKLVAEATSRGLKLNEREIRRRLQCARAYPTETQIGRACDQFETWRDLYNAAFPAIERPPGEPNADYRTPAEKRRSAARRLAEMVGDQGTLFPLEQFEPDEATLKDLAAYAEEQAELTTRFVEHDRKRSEYLAALVDAANDDLSMTWQAAHRLAFGGDVE